MADKNDKLGLWQPSLESSGHQTGITAPAFNKYEETELNHRLTSIGFLIRQRSMG